MINVTHLDAPVCSSLNQQEHKQERKKNKFKPKQDSEQEITMPNAKVIAFLRI